MAKAQRFAGFKKPIFCFFLPDSSSAVGAGKTALTNASAALNISFRRELASAVTTCTGANIGAVATLGTWVDPGATKVNFKKIDDTNLPGLYEIHFQELVFAGLVSSAVDRSRYVAGMITATGIAPVPFEIEIPETAVYQGKATGSVDFTHLVDSNVPLFYPNASLLGRAVIFLSGNNAGQQTQITAHVAGSSNMTVNTCSNAPNSGDEFCIF